MSGLRIEVAYRPRSGETWTTISLTPEEYFYAEELKDAATGDEPLGVTSIPRFDNAHAYTPLEPAALGATRVKIEEPARPERLTITTTFWHEGRCSIAERSVVRDGREVDWQLIQSTQVSHEPEVTAILRLVRREGVLEPAGHWLMSRNADGTESTLVNFRAPTEER